MKVESWERPNCPTGELGEIFETAEEIRAIEHAPAVSLTHFFLAWILRERPDRAKDYVKLFKKVVKGWEKRL